MIDSDGLAVILHAVVELHGSQQKAAKSLRVSPQYLGDVLNGRRPLSGRIVAALGYRRVVMFEQIRRAR